MSVDNFGQTFIHLQEFVSNLTFSAKENPRSLVFLAQHLCKFGHLVHLSIRVCTYTRGITVHNNPAYKGIYLLLLASAGVIFSNSRDVTTTACDT